MSYIRKEISNIFSHKIFVFIFILDFTCATNMSFSHERLKVYKRAIEFVAWRRKKQDAEMKREMKMKSEEDMHTTYDAEGAPSVGCI